MLSVQAFMIKYAKDRILPPCLFSLQCDPCTKTEPVKKDFIAA